MIICLLFQLNGMAGNESLQSNNALYFKTITVENGLSQATVNCFVEDKLGFVWVGTDDGLNKYDGNGFDIYRQQKGSTQGLSNSSIQSLAEDAEGNIWIGTTAGLNKFDIYKQQITQYEDSTNNNRYSYILMDTANQKIWLAADIGGIKYLDLQTGKIEKCYNSEYPEILARELIQINAHEILIGTRGNGIFKMDIFTHDFSIFLNDTTKNFRLPTNVIGELRLIDDKLIFGTGDSGVCFYDLVNHTSKIINTNNSNLSSNRANKLAIDLDNNIYIGTDKGGINILNIENQEIQTFIKEDANPRSLSSDVIRAIYFDSEGNKWIGTYHGGINFISNSSNNMNYFGKELLNNNSLNNNVVTCFEDDNTGGLWIGTDGGGLNHFSDGQFSVIGKGKAISNLNDNVVMCLDKTNDGALLIGTFWGGLNVYKNGIISKYVHNENDPNSISTNWIWDIEVGSSGNYWIGTNNGLNKFDPGTGKFELFKPISDPVNLHSRNNIRSLLLDSENNLWIGSIGGFGKFNITNNAFEYFISMKDGKGLESDNIVTIFEDSRGNLWIGTYGGGLHLFDKEKRRFKTFQEKDGLPGNLVQSIEEDSSGNLWISTTNGLAKFNPKLGFFQTMGKSFGLQGDEFKHNSSYNDKDGNMFFGGVEGFNMFHPDSMSFPQSAKEVIISDFQIFNQSINSETHGHILSKSINFTDDISLKYDESRFFSVHFTIPNYNDPDKVKFAYKLEGFDKDWNYIGNERKVTFTSLSPHKYILKLKASSNNLWPEEYSSLNLNIIPPFYMKMEFILFSIIAFISLILGAFKYRSYNFQKRRIVLEGLVDQKNRKINNQNKKLKEQNIKLLETQEQLQTANSTLEEKVKRRTKKLNITVEKLNKSVKELDRFVYSASHDLGAPLKSIQGLINITRLENKDQNIVIHLDYIEKSIMKLEKVITDLIQFSRNSRAELISSEINLLSFIDEIIHSLQFQPEFDQFKFDIAIPKEVIVNSDRQRLHMIIHNLLSNAIKYQDNEKPTNWARINYMNSSNSWILEVQDNGIGIEKERNNKVFEMFYRATELSDGSGLGLFIVKEAVEKLGGKISLKSELKEGSSFKIEFPLTS